MRPLYVANESSVTQITEYSVTKVTVIAATTVMEVTRVAANSGHGAGQAETKLLGLIQTTRRHAMLTLFTRLLDHPVIPLLLLLLANALFYISVASTIT
jgi:hypothetical protein